MKFLLGIAVVLLATSATVNAGLDDSIENYFDDLGDFFKDKGEDWLDSWKTDFEKTLANVDAQVKQQIIDLFKGTTGKALLKKVKAWSAKNATEKKQELENDDDLKEIVALLQQANGGPAPLALSGLLATAMMSLFMLF